MSPATYKPIMRYPGGKARIANWIVDHLPPHRIYVEPYFGGGSVLFSKPRASVEVANDLDGRVVNLFKVIRDRPEEFARAIALTPYARVEFEQSDQGEDSADEIEAARRFLVRVWMGHAGRMGSKPGWRVGTDGSQKKKNGGISNVWVGVPERVIAIVERLQNVMIECRPAVEVITQWNQPDALIYADPPYVWSTREKRGRGRHYFCEMSNDDHIELLSVLKRHCGPVVLSGYRCSLYDTELSDWRRVDLETIAYRNSKRIESLWLNPVAAATARQPVLFGVPS